MINPTTTPATNRAATMGTARMMGVPKTPAKISDKTAVGSTVAAARLTVENDDDEDNDDTGSAEMTLRALKSTGVNSGDALRGTATKAWCGVVAVVGDTTKHSMEPRRHTKESKRDSSCVMIAVCQSDRE